MTQRKLCAAMGGSNATEHQTRRHFGNRIALGRRGVLAGGLRRWRASRRGHYAAPVVPQGKLTLAWHTNIAARWLDPQQHDGTASPDNFLMAMHDGLIKNFRDELYDHPALAERFEFAEDAKSATFRLRAGTKFHDGTPVTPADVKWSYEHYRGAWGEVMRERTQGVEVVDDRTVRFHFKEPFLDFPILLGTANVCGAGWVVPATLLREGRAVRLSAEADRRRSLSAGVAGTGREARVGGVRRLLPPGPHQAVHHGQRTGGGDPGRDARTRRSRHRLFHPGRTDRSGEEQSQAAPGAGGFRQLVAQFPGFQNPSNPFHDKRVRQAISLAVDRDAINDAECGGMGVVDGNWINNDVEYGLEWPKWPRDIAKAKQLMAEAGYPNGFNVDWVTPTPNYYSRGERIVSQLQAIGIRSRLQVMERGVYLKKMQGGLREWPGVQIIFNATRIGGTWSNWYDSMFKCGGFNSKDFFCVKELDDQFTKYLASYDRNERKQMAEQIQKTILEEYYFVPVFRHAFVNAIGPRLAMQKWQDVFPTITTGYAYPWEDIQLA